MTHSDPFEEMRQHMNRLFRDFYDLGRDFESGLTARQMPVDVEETDDQVIVRADLPGVDKDSIQVRVQDNTLHIRAEGHREVHEEGKDYVRQERSRKQLSRSLPLPAHVDASSASAEYEDGVLTVTVDKTETSQGTDVEVE